MSRPSSIEEPPDRTATARAGGPAGPSAPARSATEPARAKHFLDVLGKRRHFLVDAPSQLRAGLLATVVTGVLLVMLNFSLHSARTAGTESVLAESPELRLVLEGQNRTEAVLILAGSIVFLAGVFVVTILETHKTAGAAFNIARHIVRLRDGSYETRLKLRSGDNLASIETAFNELAIALGRLAQDDAVALERFAVGAENLSGPEDARVLAGRIRQHAASRRNV